MSAERRHFLLGWLLLAIFIATGVYLKFFVPDQYLDNPAIRYQLRANHVYILMASLVNLAFSAAVPSLPADRRPRLRRAGSILLLIAPAIIVAAFIIDPPRASPHRWLTDAGVVLLAAGVVLRATSRPRR